MTGRIDGTRYPDGNGGAPVERPAALLRCPLRVEHDIFILRQRGREVASAVGLEHQDQVRVATALSEVARYLLTRAGGADVAFHLLTPIATAAVLRVEFVPVTPVTQDDMRSGPPAMVSRLVDSLVVEGDGRDTVVRMSRRTPQSTQPFTPDRLAQLRAGLAATAPHTALDELALQNEQLVVALDEVRRHRDELAAVNAELATVNAELASVNAELEETNRGVMALYNQLSEELEQTNRGVVALYAELDEKSAQLRAASEAKSRFLANVSHELRAPVTAIMGLGRLLTDSTSDALTPEQARQVGLIRSSAADLLSLVNDLLDLAKAESGRIEPRWSEVDLRVVFGQLRGTLRALETPSGVELVVAEPPSPATIRTDEVLLSQILRNLLHNALKFTEEGEVRMRAERSGESWRLLVSDTGPGIPAELHERIFEEFYQAPGPARTTGTGLGLPYARRLAVLLGGALQLTSEPGRGSTFTVTLPVRGG